MCGTASTVRVMCGTVNIVPRSAHAAGSIHSEAHLRGLRQRHHARVRREYAIDAARVVRDHCVPHEVVEGVVEIVQARFAPAEEVGHGFFPARIVFDRALRCRLVAEA